MVEVSKNRTSQDGYECVSFYLKCSEKSTAHIQCIGVLSDGVTKVFDLKKLFVLGISRGMGYGSLLLDTAVSYTRDNKAVLVIGTYKRTRGGMEEAPLMRFLERHKLSMTSVGKFMYWDVGTLPYETESIYKEVINLLIEQSA